MSETVLQQHLKRQTIPPREIREELNVDYTTLRKWGLGVLFPHRLNARQLILLFSRHGVRLDYNDIYQLNDMDKAI